MESSQELIPQIYTAASFIGLYLVLILLAKLANDMSTPYSVDEHLAEKDNLALATSFSGYLLSVTIIFIAVLVGPSKGLLQDLANVAGYSALGIVLLNISRVINDKLILYQFKNIEKIIDEGNVGTGVVQFGSYLASAFVIAGAVNGEGGGVVTALVFFAIGQVALIIMAKIYDLLTPFNVHDEIASGNTAAGIAMAGSLIALGIILMKGSSGNFVSWNYNLSYFAIESLVAFIILPIIRIIMDKIIIYKIDLNKEIKEDKNIGAGLMEMAMIVGFAAMLFFLV